MIRVFAGHDRGQPVLLSVLTHSLNVHSTSPLSITPISLDHLGDLFTRERNPLQSTEFSFSRFLVPYLAGYEGWAIFMDNDFLARADITELWNLRDDKYAVMCVKHDHVPKEEMKFLGTTQTQYAKKNWSSMMLINCAKCTALTPEYVNSATGLELHQFKWLESEDLIGEVPHYWNYLVDYYNHDEKAKLLHFTEGGPYYEGYRNCDYADEWLAAFRDVNSTADTDLKTLADVAYSVELEKKRRYGS